MKPDAEIAGTINVFPNPILRKRCQEIWKYEDDDISHLKWVINQMEHIARAHEIPLAGIAGNQVKLHRNNSTFIPNQRIILILDENENWFHMLNPKIEVRSEQTEWGTEGCASIPNEVVNVKRNYGVTVTWATTSTLGDFVDERLTKKFEGRLARVIQHEIDHLDGILITDRGDTVIFAYPS